LSDAGRELHRRFVDAVDDDLDMPSALAVVRSIGRADLPVDERRWLLLDADLVLGLDLGRPHGPDTERLDPRATDLIAERTASRAAGDYARADAIRDELRSLGLDVTDGADGTTHWRRTPT
jgi:cysteinyl-tRNA synthetase